jgi:hypothetical protein
MSNATEHLILRNPSKKDFPSRSAPKKHVP